WTLPRTLIRDVIVTGHDSCAGTHGRGIWILDDITPLRQIQSSQPSVNGSRNGRSAPAVAEGFGGSGERSTMLFAPQIAYRVRQNTNTDTPIPPDEAYGLNPPPRAPPGRPPGPHPPRGAHHQLHRRARGPGPGDPQNPRPPPRRRPPLLGRRSDRTRRSRDRARAGLLVSRAAPAREDRRVPPFH